METANGSSRREDGANARDAQTVNGSVKAGDDIEAEDLGTVNGDLHVGERARISGGIETVNGGIFVGRGGNVAKGIETVNGENGIVAPSWAPTHRQQQETSPSESTRPNAEE